MKLGSKRWKPEEGEEVPVEASPVAEVFEAELRSRPMPVAVEAVAGRSGTR